MSAHTKGPWRVDPDYFHDVQTADGGEIAMCFSLGDANAYAGRMVASEEEAGANARLIAAAPELLAEMAALHEAAEALLNTVNVIWGKGPEDDDDHTHEKWAMDDLRKRVAEAAAVLTKATGEAP
jgi:hypothetical protein